MPWFNLVLVAINEQWRPASRYLYLEFHGLKSASGTWELLVIPKIATNIFTWNHYVQLFFSKEKWEIGDFTENPFFSSPFLFLTLLSNKQEMPKKSNIFFTSAAAMPQDIRVAQCPKNGKIIQITARGEHDSFQKNQPKMNFDFRSLCTLKLILHFLPS